MENNLFLIWSEDAAISLVVWSIITVIVFYLGRQQAHQVLKSSGQAVFAALRSFSFGLKRFEKKLIKRNHDIMLAQGEKAAEKAIEREFSRVNQIIQRDLSKYPALHRQISDSIEKIERDYQNSTQTTPLPPAWGEVVETIANLPSSGDPTVVKILSNIKKAVNESHQQILSAFKKSSAQSHQLLGRMQPEWRKIDSKLIAVEEKINNLDQCSKNIDQQINDYAEILHRKDPAISALSSSALTQFFISGLVLIIAVLGGLINFQLIALPMSEMVGGSSYIGAMKTSDIAALVIILIEIAMGLFLFESLRITHLFPIIGSMDDRLRRRMMIVTFMILTILATIEASLAYMRDLLALDREALQQSLISSGASSGIVEAQFRWIPSVGQMIMGFILPFALAFIAIPLESFIHSFRVVLGMISIALIRFLIVTLRVIGGVFKHLTKIAVNLFDLIIMLPLSIEKLVQDSRQKGDAETAIQSAETHSRFND